MTDQLKRWHELERLRADVRHAEEALLQGAGWTLTTVGTEVKAWAYEHANGMVYPRSFVLYEIEEACRKAST
jgi:hypothetical protein